MTETAPTPYDQVVQILQSYGWSQFAAPAPGPVALALETATPDQVATRINDYVFRVHTDSHFYPSFEQATYSLFCKGKEYWELSTSIALGQQYELPVEKVADAHTVEQFLWNLNHGYNRLGYKDLNCGPDSEQGKLRRAAAKVPPAEFAGYEGIWELAVLSGSYQVGLTGFAPAYAQMTPKLHEIRGLDPQQFLDNLWTPGKWRPTQAAK